MSLSKTASLPHIKGNFNKYDNFFAKHPSQKDLAMQDENYAQQQTDVQRYTDIKNKQHARNLQFINKKSTIKSKVEAFLIDSRKMGILDHTTNETQNRRSLSKVNLESIKPVLTEIQQQKNYLFNLKKQLNQFHQTNHKIQQSIKNKEGMTTQVKQKIIFYQQLMEKTWQGKEDLLVQRQRNIQVIRYETNILKYMQERDKQINLFKKRKIRDAQTMLKASEKKAKIMNEELAMAQDYFDNRQYLSKNYDEFEFKKSESLGYKTDKAMTNMKQNFIGEKLKKHQESLIIMDKEDYNYQTIRENHAKLLSELQVEKFYRKALDSTWTRYSSFYQSYEKAEKIIKMHSLDRKEYVQISYLKSFQIKENLELKIKEKEKRSEELQAKKKILSQQWSKFEFGEIDEKQKIYEKMNKYCLTGKQNIKTHKQSEQHQYHRKCLNRLEETERKRKVYLQIKDWVAKNSKKLQITNSKRLGLSEHLKNLILTVHQNCKENQQKIKSSLSQKTKSQSKAKLTKITQKKKSIV